MIRQVAASRVADPLDEVIAHAVTRPSVFAADRPETSAR
jgi:hypothetical protein